MIVEDLYNFAPDFMDKHRQVITGASAPKNNNRSSNASISGSGSMAAKIGASALRQSMNNDLASMQSQA